MAIHAEKSDDSGRGGTVLKIAFVAQPFDALPSRSGSSLAIWVDELARRLSTQHEVRVFCAEVPDSEETDFDAYDIERISTRLDEKIEAGVGSIERRLGWIDQVNRAFYHRYYYYSWPCYFKYANSVARSVSRFQPDWVILLNFSQFVPTFRFWNGNARIFLMMQCDWLVEMPYGSTRRRLSSVNAIGGCSQYIADGVGKRFPEYNSKCHTVYNASDTERFNASDSVADEVENLRGQYHLHGKRVILFVGRMAPEKGVHTLLQAMAEVIKKHPNTVLLLAGNVSRQPPSPKWIFDADCEFENFATLNHNYGTVLEDLGKGLGESLRVLGHVNHYELPSLYSLADIFVHPAIWNEPFGMILTEAMACGTPVISTKSGGIPEIIEAGATGLLGGRGKVGELANAIMQLLENDELREQIGLRSQNLVRDRFTWEKTVGMLLDVLEN